MEALARRFYLDRVLRISAQAHVHATMDRPDDAHQLGSDDTTDADERAATRLAEEILLDDSAPDSLVHAAQMMRDGEYEQAMNRAATALKRAGGMLTVQEFEQFKRSRDTSANDSGARARSMVDALLGVADDVDRDEADHAALIAKAREREQAGNDPSDLER